MKFYKITGHPNGLTQVPTYLSYPKIFSLGSFTGSSGFDSSKIVFLVVRYTVIVDTNGLNQNVFLSSTLSNGSSVNWVSLKSMSINSSQDCEHNTSGILYIPVSGMTSVNVDFYYTWQRSDSHVRRMEYQIIGAVTT